MEKERIQYLFQQQAAGKLSLEEEMELSGLLASKDEGPVLDAMTELIEKESGEPGEISPAAAERSFRQIVGIDRLEGMPPVKRMRIRSWAWAAAVIGIMLGAGAYFLFQHSREQTRISASRPLPADIAPGTNKAILTLANGQQITLDDAKKGQLLNQSGIIVTKTDSGQIVYKVNASHGLTGYNTIRTPRGGQYQIILPDGTHVWLNAASSLRYPVAFTGNDRQTELTGEAYFEVARDEAKPFRIASKGQLVEVLGTSFNINAYEDEHETRTTLITGAVKVNNKTLRPGQQAVLSAGVLQTQEADAEEAIAWKNGYFVFNDEDLASIMRKIERWYNVEVTYKDKALTTQRFNGTVSRYGHVSQVIKVLELTQAAYFTIEGNKITVSAQP